MNCINSKNSWHNRLSKASFFICLFFALFGLHTPFQPEIKNPSELVTQNTFRQIAYSTLYITSIITLIPIKKILIEELHKLKYLLLFLTWCLITISWSEHAFTSLKRWIQITGTSIVVISAVLHTRSSEEILQIIKILVSTYIIISIISIFIVSEASSPETGAWKGLAQSKNGLGQIALIGIILFYYSDNYKHSKIRKFISFLFVSISLALLLGSQSTTATLTAITLLTIHLTHKFIKWFLAPLIGEVTSALIVTFFIVISILIAYINPDLFESLFSVFGKNTTFTGRVELWGSILENTQQHLLYGCGFGGYWVLDSITILDLYMEHTWLPNQSHQGYLDIVNETGIIGLFLFSLVILHSIRSLINQNQNSIWVWFTLVCIIVNFTESTFINQQAFISTLFLTACIACITQYGLHKPSIFIISKKHYVLS